MEQHTFTQEIIERRLWDTLITAKVETNDYDLSTVEQRGSLRAPLLRTLSDDARKMIITHWTNVMLWRT